MESFLVSISTIVVAELGDRTQLLSLMLAAQFRRPWPILSGILCATLINNVVAGLIGARVARFLTPTRLDVAVGVSMIAMALWTLKPEKADEKPGTKSGASAFTAAFIALFIAELGDKTQIATLALAAAYSSTLAVVAGATVGELIAIAPVVFLGKVFAQRLPLKLIRYLASALFVLVGVVFLLRAFHRV